jgi:hypothetical protein
MFLPLKGPEPLSVHLKYFTVILPLQDLLSSCVDAFNFIRYLQLKI